MFDHSGVDYREVCWIPVISAPQAYWKTGKRTVPFIEVEADGGNTIVHDSTEILLWAAEHLGPLGLIPVDPELRAAAMAIEDRVDDVGEDVIRYMYAPMIQHPTHFVEVWGWGSTPLRKHTLRAALPLIRPIMARVVGFSASERAAGKQRIHDVFAELDAQLADGRSFLVGDRLTIADVSAASLLAPVFTPPEHEVYASDVFRASLRSAQREFTQYRSFHWLRSIYRDHRRAHAVPS